MPNSTDPDEMPHSVASHLDLHCLLRPVCPNTYGKYDIYYSKEGLFLFVQVLLRIMFLYFRSVS